jgi:outer membrane protein assembly factor BamB
MRIAFPYFVRRFVAWCVLGAVSYGASAVVEGEDWPQWRGPRSDGISRETGLLIDWTNKAPRVVWQRPLGRGFSSFAVAGGGLYTMAAVDDVEYVLRLDPETGQTVWQVAAGTTYRDSQGGDGPRSTPTVDGDAVYALGAEGTLLCLDTLSGKVRWRRNVLEDFDGENLTWGVSTSPYVDRQRLLVNVGAKRASIVAFEKNSGKVFWQNLDDIAGYASPIRIEVTGPDGQVVPELVFFCGRALVGVSPEDGREHWRYEWITTSDMNIATPIYEPQSRLLFVSAARDTGRCSTYRLTANQGTVISELVYTNKEMRNHYNSCVLLDGYLYGFDNSILKCIRLETGALMWSDRSVGKGSLVAAQGHLFVLGEYGDLAVVEATPVEYRQKGQFKALESGRAWTPPALANGRLYIRDLENAVAIDISEP